MQKANSKANPLRRLIGCITELFERRPVIYSMVLALLLELVLEMLGRHSFLKGVLFLVRHPLHFTVNAMIIMSTLAICHLFRRRFYLLNLVAAIWLLLGVVNAVVRCFRSTPLEAVDFSILPSAISILEVYIDPWVIALLIVVLLVGILWLIAAFWKAKRYPSDLKQAAVFVLVCVLVTALGYGATVWGQQEERKQIYSNIIDAYEQYGFVYCFATGAVDRGISEPDSYSRNTMFKLTQELTWHDEEPVEKPDIVMVQLESFIDVSRLDDVSYEEDPIPVFRQLKENGTSGYLTVPAIGAGTANTEFEVLSGMSLDFFGMGEYPYMTILRDRSCETIATDLKALGYTAHAIHNNTGTFYDRNSVFAQLGFDTYTSIEFMNDVEYNPIGWAKDSILTGEIIETLNSSDDPHFIFTITVQGHGKYQPGVDSADAEGLNVAWVEDESDEDAFAYYVGQLRETDTFIGELVDALQQRGKPVVLVLYGDHLPNIDIGSEQLRSGGVFETEYAIWTNTDLALEDRNLDAYQLSARVLEGLGIDGGILTRYHQLMQGRIDYQDGLQLLEYDRLYGENYCYGGAYPNTPSNLQMGLYPIVVENATWEDGYIFVSGEHFTDWSRITVEEEELDTVLRSDGTLVAELEDAPESGSLLTVRQRSSDRTSVLAESDPFTWP